MLMGLDLYQNQCKKEKDGSAVRWPVIPFCRHINLLSKKVPFFSCTLAETEKKEGKQNCITAEAKGEKITEEGICWIKPVHMQYYLMHIFRTN